jgi:hypothetical protein
VRQEQDGMKNKTAHLATSMVSDLLHEKQQIQTVALLILIFRHLSSLVCKPYGLQNSRESLKQIQTQVAQLETRLINIGNTFDNVVANMKSKKTKKGKKKDKKSKK